MQKTKDKDKNLKSTQREKKIDYFQRNSSTTRVNLKNMLSEISPSQRTPYYKI